MGSKGKVFGTSGEVNALGSLAKTCVAAIEDNNQKAQSLLSQLSGSTRDAAYDEAEEVVSEVKKIVSSCKDPLESVCGALSQYAEFLTSMGR